MGSTSLEATSIRKTLRVLLVEDSVDDADLLLAELVRSGYDVIAERVQTADEMRAALTQKSWHLVLSDYSLPSFSAPAALAITKESHPELPFIIVSGTIGEDTAVSALKAGAADFLVKGRLARLIPAIERELREVQLRGQREREREALEERLRQAQQLEGIGRLAGGVAHDFNNLLTAIIGYTEMVLDQIGPDKPISEDLNEIRRASDRAVALTRQLLAFSRKQTLHVVPTDLNDIILTMRSMLQRLISEDIEIRVELAPGLASILADRIQVEQVLMNLVMNARDAMPRGGRVTVQTTAADAREAAAMAHESVTPGDYVRLQVSDTGMGMDAATQARMFEPFFTTKAVGQGTGLGLATVYGVVQQLRGHIAVSSEIGHGTTFSLYFPEAGTSAVTLPAAPQKPAAPLAERRELVLVVEDQHAVRHLLSRILTRHGYTVLAAADAGEAFAHAQSHDGPIDLVVSDVVMPTMGGPELVERLRTLRPTVKVLYISGYTGDDLSARIDRETTTARVLEKPFTASVLLQTVRDVLDDRDVVRTRT